jgi:hypothetical protein
VLFTQFYLQRQTVFTVFRAVLFRDTAVHRLQKKYEVTFLAMPSTCFRDCYPSVFLHLPAYGTAKQIVQLLRRISFYADMKNIAFRTMLAHFSGSATV